MLYRVEGVLWQIRPVCTKALTCNKKCLIRVIPATDAWQFEDLSQIKFQSKYFTMNSIVSVKKLTVVKIYEFSGHTPTFITIF